MHKHNLTKLAVPLAIIGTLLLVYFVPAAFSQEDMTMVPASAFESMERAQVAFEHDLHNEKAELDDCVICHHGMTEDGKQDLEYSSEGESCDSCHAVERTDDGTPLMRAYHRQCGTCHAESLAGPVTCGECHKK